MGIGWGGGKDSNLLKAGFCCSQSIASYISQAGFSFILLLVKYVGVQVSAHLAGLLFLSIHG